MTTSCLRTSLLGLVALGLAACSIDSSGQAATAADPSDGGAAGLGSGGDAGGEAGKGSFQAAGASGTSSIGGKGGSGSDAGAGGTGSKGGSAGAGAGAGGTGGNPAGSGGNVAGGAGGSNAAGASAGGSAGAAAGTGGMAGASAGGSSAGDAGAGGSDTAGAGGSEVAGAAGAEAGGTGGTDAGGTGGTDAGGTGGTDAGGTGGTSTGTGTCGNGAVEPGEECDPGSADQDGNAGAAECNKDCTVPCDGPYDYRDTVSHTCFFVRDSALPWEKAVVDCAENGGKLAILDDRPEAVRLGNKLGSVGAMWVAGKQTGNKKNGVGYPERDRGWEWQDGGQKLPFGDNFPWESGQPNDGDAWRWEGDNGTQDCAETSSAEQMYFNDAPCGDSKFPLCEVPR